LANEGIPTHFADKEVSAVAKCQTELIYSIIRSGVIVDITYAEQLFRSRGKLHSYPSVKTVGLDKTMEYMDKAFVCAPPFPMFWMEYHGVFSETASGHTGLAVMVFDLDKKKGFTAMQLMNTFLSLSKQPPITQGITSDPSIIKFNESRWVFNIVIVLAEDGRPLSPSMIGMMMGVSRDGKVRGSWPLIYTGAASEEHWDNLKSVMTESIMPMYEALTLMHCKNIDTHAIPMEPRLNKYCKSRFGRNKEDYKYHILVVRPPGSNKDEAAIPLVQQEESGTKLHSVRGGYATYTEAAPMFGRLVGTFYRPWHMSGNPKYGTIEKDYKLGSDDET
jgi:hypothetical protein